MKLHIKDNNKQKHISVISQKENSTMIMYLMDLEGFKAFVDVRVNARQIAEGTRWLWCHIFIALSLSPQNPDFKMFLMCLAVGRKLHSCGLLAQHLLRCPNVKASMEGRFSMTSVGSGADP